MAGRYDFSGAARAGRNAKLADIATSAFQSGFANAPAFMQEKRMRDMVEMEKDKVALEQDAANAVNQVYQEEQALTQKRAAGAKVLSQLRNLASQPTSIRKTTAPVIFDAMEQGGGQPLAENFKQFVMSGKPEEVGPILDRVISEYSNNPERTVDDLAPVFTSPLASAELIGGLSREVQDSQNRAAVLGPEQKARRDKFATMRASRERQIQKLEGVVSRFANTKTAEVARQKITQLQGELEKMQTLLSGQEATDLGVRPGTTLTESGTGNIGVLQGPNDSKLGSGGPGGLEASAERFLKSLAASEFDTEINLQTGEVIFKNRAEAALANQLTAAAGRIYADSGGRLTLAEAYQQAKRANGGGGTDGNKNPFDQFDQPGR